MLRQTPSRVCLRMRFFTCALLVCLSLYSISSAQTGGITYVYDELGRLVAVIDPSGDTAKYTYDATGNLLSISRYNSSIVSLISFTPSFGPVGTAVTIYGTAFSTTPSQNTVAFNGVNATITSATSTQLVAIVPTGATTGTISVTTTAGSATSSTAFVVGNPGAPTISGFSPSVAAIGTSVTITGTNFETTPSYNRVKINTTHSQVSSATSTTIATSVSPSTASGHVSVSTSGGSAISADDLFIVRPPFVASDVVYTGRVNIGPVNTVSVGTANKIAMVLFDGSAGQRVSFGISNGTMGWAQISVVSPNGATLLTPTWINNSGFIDTKTLPITGTYSIVIDPEDANTGSLNIQIYNVPADTTGTLTAGGSALTVTTTTPGQNARISFQGSSGEKVFLIASDVVMGGTGWSQLSILKPDGSTLVSPTWVNAYKTFDTVTLPAAGAYTIVVDPESTNTGSMVLRLYHPSLTNDNFADAAVITGNSSSLTGTNVGATKESGEPNHGGSAGGKSVWYRWQPAQSGTVTISTASSNFDTLLAVYTGNAVNSLTTIGSDDDGGPSHTSRVTFTAVASTVYYIAVDGYANSTGNIVLNWATANTAELLADYRFQNTRQSSLGHPPDIVDLGTNNFASTTVDGTATTVLTFSQNNGVSLSPTTGLIANDAYTVVVLCSLSQSFGWRRIADFKNGTSDYGLYDQSGHLYFYPSGYGNPVSISDNTYVQVVLTREANGVVTGYVNGTQQFQFTDTGGIAIIDGNNSLRFFRDDGSEASAGSVARIRIYNGALTATQVAALDRLP